MTWIASILCLSLVAAAMWFGVPWVSSWRARRRLRRHCAATGTLVLSFDDGPGPELTPRVLDILAEYSARATFFVLGERAAACPAFVDRIAAEGHELGAHTHAHVDAWRAWPAKALRDVAQAYETLARWLGPAALFRPAHGRMTLATWIAQRRRGARFAWWTHDGGDTGARLPDGVPIVDRIRRDGGGVVLLHDFDREPERLAYVAAMTRALLETARRQKWRIRTVGQVLDEISAGGAPR